MVYVLYALKKWDTQKSQVALPLSSFSHLLHPIRQFSNEADAERNTFPVRICSHQTTLQDGAKRANCSIHGQCPRSLRIGADLQQELDSARPRIAVGPIANKTKATYITPVDDI
jgi:hypothetical protein